MEKKTVQTLTVQPTEASIIQVAAFVEETMEQGGLAPKLLYKVNIAVDEMYSNIVRYSGAKTAVVECELSAEEAVLRLRDDGAAFNPLEMAAPDTSLKAEAREIGGLGIFMTRKLMTRVEYQRQNGQNILTMALSLA